MSRRVVVVGGGITGLATAWHLRERHDVVLLEASPRLGGAIHTVPFAGAAFDVGAEAILARRPEGLELLGAAGFGNDELVSPVASRVLLLVRGRLRPLPPSTVLGVPTDLAATIRSGVLTGRGAARAALAAIVPSPTPAADRSVADLVGHHFGREVVDTLVEPLVAGVYAGRADRLSGRATMPVMWSAAQDRRGAARALAAERDRRREQDGPVFVTLPGGLSQLVERLARDLGPAVHLQTRASAVEARDTRWRIRTDRGELAADQVVLAVPPAAAARLLGQLAPEVARHLCAIRTASVAVVALAYDAASAGAIAPDVSGYLVPRGAGGLVKAVTFSSRKWAHHAVRDRFVLRASVGRIDESDALELDDEPLAAKVDAEIRRTMGIVAPARAWSVTRWLDALPQYDVGHSRRVERIRTGLGRALRGLHLGGAAFDGVGLAARAADARRLVAEVDGETSGRERGEG